jgi:hypothetical protein
VIGEEGMSMLAQARNGFVRGFAVVLVVLGLAALVSAPVAAQEESVTINLDELNGSGVSGTATMTADGDSTTVSIEVSGATGDHPAHIHQGTCDNLNPNPEYPLENVNADGLSETTVDVPLQDLLDGEFAVNLHQSTTNLGVYIACGNVVAAAAEEEAAADEEAAAPAATETPAAAGGTTATTTPATGSGSMAASANGAVLAGLGALALSLTLGGLVLRRRAVRI